MTKAKQVAIISSSPASGLARAVVESLHTEHIIVPHIDVGINLLRPSNLKPEQIVISSDQYLDDNSAGIVIFTSGKCSLGCEFLLEIDADESRYD